MLFASHQVPSHASAVDRPRRAAIGGRVGKFARLVTRGVAGGLVAALLMTGATAAAVPQTLYVATTGSDAGACTFAAPCLTIGHAVATAVPGDTIVVRAGTYREAVVVAKRLTLIGHHAVIDATGILASVPGPLAANGIIGWGVLIVGPGSAGSVFRGFTVENAPAEGILAALTSKVSILDNQLHGNDAGATTPFVPMPSECAAQGNVPGDCGEAVHLLSVTNSRVVGNNVHDNVGGILLTDEVGPTSGNLVARNISRNNKLDCGITLPSHNGAAVADPTKGGVYNNTILFNVSEGNGGAGVGMFAPFPGTASYDNRVIGNVLRNNGEAGVGIHSHAPGQNVSGNVIVANWISGNGVDPDSGSPVAHNGIVVFSAVDAVSVTIAANRIANEDDGIYLAGHITVHGLPSNHFASSVTTRIVHAL